MVADGEAPGRHGLVGVRMAIPKNSLSVLRGALDARGCNDVLFGPVPLKALSAPGISTLHPAPRRCAAAWNLNPASPGTGDALTEENFVLQGATVLP
ncbi:MAG: hypothetical protein ACK6DF_02615 [Betaproteobacteria bacterium]|jgi:hypothetical protein